MQDISLEWWRDALGYRIEEATPPPELPRNMLRTLLAGYPEFTPGVTLPELWRASRPADLGNPERIVPNGGTRTPYRPSETIDLIFCEFVSTDPTAEGLRDFMNRFGPLTRPGLDPEVGEPVKDATEFLAFLTEFIDAWGEETKSVRKRALAKVLGTDGLRVAGVEVRLVFDERTQAPRTQQVALDLETALFLRLFDVLLSDTVLRRCKHCNALFTAGLGTDRHLNARFCSDEHRILFNSLKRTPKAA